MIYIKLPDINILEEEEKKILKLEKYRDDIKNRKIDSFEKLKEKKDIDDFLINKGYDYIIYIYSRFCVIFRNYGNCKNRKNGTEEEQYFGILSQVILSIYLNQDGINYKDDEDDRGIDYIINNCNVDIKNTGRNFDLNKGYVFNLFSEQVHNKYLKSDFYILSSFNKKNMNMSISSIVPRKIIPYICKFYYNEEYSIQNSISGDLRYEVIEGLIEKDFGVNKIEDIYIRCNKEILTKSIEELLENSFYNKCNEKGYIESIDNVEINFYNFTFGKKEEIKEEIKNKVRSFYLRDFNIDINKLLKNDLKKVV